MDQKAAPQASTWLDSIAGPLTHNLLLKTFREKCVGQKEQNKTRSLGKG
jgi:hypothetical protein